MLQVARVSRLPLARFTQRQCGSHRLLSIVPTAVLRADLVQDLYLKELKNYKPPILKASDATGHVQTFSPPKPPPSPEQIEIASELKAYENQQVEIEGQSVAGEEAEVDELTKYFENLIEEEEDEEAPH